MNELEALSGSSDLGEPAELGPQPPASGIAYRLANLVREAGPEGLIAVTTSEIRAAETAAALRCFGPDIETILLPPWDCLPYDRVSPSRSSMGRRLAAIASLAARCERPRVLVAAVDALVQRLPPRHTVATAQLSLETGTGFDREAFEAFMRRIGYVVDERVDEPGEIAVFGQVIDIFPAADDRPVRLVLEETGRIVEIRRYDPLSQRSYEPLERLQLGPASELIAAESGDPEPLGPGAEHRIANAYDRLETVFTLLPKAALCMGPHAAARLAVVFDQIREARDARIALGDEPHLGERQPLYLDGSAWDEAVVGRERRAIAEDHLDPAPDLFRETRPARALVQFVRGQWAMGHRVLVTGMEPELNRIAATLARAKLSTAVATDAREAPAPEAEVAALAAFDLASGFVDRQARLAVISAPNLYGARIGSDAGEPIDRVLDEPDLRVGDVVIHEDHGIGILDALEQVEVDGVARDTVRLLYKDGAVLLAPVEEFGRIWRYGSDATGLTLDKLKGDAWQRRRAQVDAEIAATAEALVALAAEREAVAAQPIRPPAAYRRVAARFPFPETRDQSAAIEAVLKDLGSTRPMNRLVCGDVGFGKTEVALRAAAAVALSGAQVAVVAPTTVLVRQHLHSFERRFAGTGVCIAQLSRLLSPAEARTVKAGLADGSIRIVIATHAIAGKDVAFDDLRLLVVDEEQRFGAQLKAQLHRLAPALNLLSMSATPIPRTLQSALVGLQDTSLLTTPPARRRPVRTSLAPFDPAAVRTALLREKRRGGQSFCVVPRIEDIGPLHTQLAQLVPELSVVLAHGDLPASEIDATMVAFANGEGDVLLATAIIESGLDVPRANTMLVWRPDRFGLAQLHQLRGRVGRGRAQGLLFLLTEPGEDLPDATQARLQTLQAFDRLGAGFALSARDLDLRGAGDIVGDEQAGHVKLIGTGLYERLLARAIRIARGERLPPEGLAELSVGFSGAIPASYVAEPVVRINLYARLLRLQSEADVDAVSEELADRFGDPPMEVELLLRILRLQLRARGLGIGKLSAGPHGIALTFKEGEPPPDFELGSDLTLSEGRLVLTVVTEPDATRLDAIAALLDRIEAASRPED